MATFRWECWIAVLGRLAAGRAACCAGYCKKEPLVGGNFSVVSSLRVVFQRFLRIYSEELGGDQVLILKPDQVRREVTRRRDA